MTARRWMAVLWPAFLAAAGGEMLLFAFVDPEELLVMGERIALSRTAIYSIGFFVLWTLAAASSMITAALLEGDVPNPSGGHT